jgi:hypothetical protein
MNQIVWTQEKKDLAIEKLTEYFQEHGVGEVIMQSDNALIEAPELLANIADKILIEYEGILYREE